MNIPRHRNSVRRVTTTAVISTMVFAITGTAVAQAAPPVKSDSGASTSQEHADEYTHIVVDKRPRGEADTAELRESLNKNGLQTAKSRWTAEGKDVESELRSAGSGYSKNGHHEHVFMWDSTKKGIEGSNAIEKNGDAIRVKIRWDALKKDGRIFSGTLKGDHGGGPLGGESTNGAWAYKGDIPRKYLFIVGVDDPAHPGMSQWLAGKGWPDGNGVCSTGGSSGRAKRSVSVCENGESPAKPSEEGTAGKPSGEALENLEAKQIEQAFGELAGKYGLKVVAPDGKQLSPSEIHARIRGYSKLSPEAKSALRANLKSAGSTAKGALLVAGGVLWAKGVHDAFANDTTSLDKAAAITAIVPFVGCGTQAGAAADHGRFDAEDTAACFGADALLVTPLWPAGLTLHGARYFTDKWKEAQIPSITVFQQARDEAWKKTLADFRADGLQKLVKSATEMERQQLEAEKAVILHNAAEKMAEIDKGGASAEAKKLLKWSTERTAREQIKNLPQKLRKQFDTAIRDALVERAKQYNEEFIKQEVNIGRWTEESWQAALHGPSQSREERQLYLDKLIQRLRDTDMLPPVPDTTTLNADIEQARKSLTKADSR
ncbi:hypothetical protein [Streptomyces blastmyceticus]|uniref:Uncharacterized protein n=1 Tax=Streptomyces blastmyceticus TaxID=68180 RepID=A0ABP3GTK9_9ACTN